MVLSIEVTGLSFGYAGSAPLLRDVDLRVGEGELCCLLGPNGAGKTTVVRCLIGLLSPERGTIRIGGVDVSGLRPRHLARQVAYVPQSTTSVFPFSTLDVVVMGRTPHLRTTDMPSAADHRAAQAVLEDLGIGHLAARPFARLSGGERQLAMIARALLQQAPVLVLDEPTAALDYGNEVGILQAIARLVADGHSVLMTTHQPNHALWWGDQAVLMSAGSVVASGPPDRVVTSDTLSALYSLPIQIGGIALPDDRSQLVCAPDLAAARRLHPQPDPASPAPPGGSP